MSSSIPIPKFASFKPKTPVEDVVKPITVAKDLARHDLGQKEHRHRHHHRRHRSRSREKSQKDIIVTQPPPLRTKDDASPLYVEDRQGDTQNLVYGSIHRYNIPAFHRVGAGSVLGAKRNIKIERISADEKGIVLSDRRDENASQREKYVFARNEQKAERLLRIRATVEEDAAGVDSLDFIALQISKPRKRARLGSKSDYSSDEDAQHYRSIEGKAKTSAKPLDEDLEWATESDSSDPESGRTIRFDEAMKKKNIELSRKVDEHPQDVDVWIALIDHQDNLLGLADGGHRKVTIAERRSTADIKLHLYEKALSKVGSSLPNRERLLLGMMAEGAKIWDFKTQSERWERISQNNLDSILLWKQYLDFRQSNFSSFRYEEVKTIYMKRTSLLKDAIADERRQSEHCILYEHLIYTVLRATLFIREAGYSELAIAVWQALLEFNFMDPPQPGTKSSRLENFQEFWDGEVLRIGEEGAKGWRNFDSDMEAPEGKADEDISPEKLKIDNMFDGWVAAEKLQTAASAMPARTLDDSTEDDPYRVILWSDVEPFMIDLFGTSFRMSISRLLLDAFLIFCRLPPLPASENLSSRQWWLDSFARADLLDCSSSWTQEHFPSSNKLETSSIEPAIISEEDKVNSPFSWPFQYFAASPDTLFADESWVKYLQPWRDPFEVDGPVPYFWLRNVLQSLLEANAVDGFPEYYLAFEFCNESQDIKKTAKRLLKHNPNSLTLYNAYAMIEWVRGNHDISTTVFTTALGLCASLPEESQADAILLWKSWTWALLGNSDNSGALRVLLAIPNGLSSNLRDMDTSSPAVQIKAKQHLSSSRDYFLSSGRLSHAVIYAECLALLDYLSSNSSKETSSLNQGDIASALAIFDNFSEAFMARGHRVSIAHELLLQSATRLLHHHVQSGPFRPALLRDHLSHSLSLFPRNTLFLSLYAWNESRLRIDDRVRSLLRMTLLQLPIDNLLTRLFAIRHELRAGTVHSAQAALESAVTSPACASNPGLWRLYVLFCLASPRLRKRYATTVFYRAIRACPWAKELFLLAFGELRSVDDLLGPQDMAAVYRILGEKELRIRVDLDLDMDVEEMGGGDGDT